MSYVYNMSSLGKNITGIDKLMIADNSITQGMFGNVIIVTIFAVLFMYFFKRTGDTGRAVSAASWICFILALLLWTVGVVDSLVIWMLLVISAASIMFTWKYK